MIFRNCRAYTLDSDNASADAIAVRDGMIIGVGTDDALNRLIGPETVFIDLSGKTVIPGLVDSHVHLIHHGLSATRTADLTGCTSIDAILNRMRDFHSTNPHLPWLLGRGFDQELLEERSWPTRLDLDKISTDIPIVISRVCLHALVANSAALNKVKSQLTKELTESGILTDDAADLIRSRLPVPTLSETESAAIWALNDAARLGLTGVHCIIHNKTELNVMLKLHKNKKLPIRVYLICASRLLKHLESLNMQTGWGDNRLNIGAIKLYMDGSLGARTAGLIEPYTDMLNESGTLLISESELADKLIELQDKGFQAAIHAIGDRAVETALNGIESAMSFGNQDNKLRHRIEHASILNPDLIRRMSALQIPASVQPQFVTSDFWACKRIGAERCEHWHPFNTMLQAGIKLGIGSDCPVDSLNPILSLHAAVNRGQNTPQEKLSISDVLAGFSQGNAYLSFREKTSGMLKVGYFADFTVLSDDPFKIDSGDLGNLSAESTIIGGRMI